MRTFLLVFFGFLALVAWVTGCVVASQLVDQIFGEGWGFFPFLASFAPVVAAIIAFQVES